MFLTVVPEIEEFALLPGRRTDRNHVRPGAAERTRRRPERLLHHARVSESADRHDRHDWHDRRDRHGGLDRHDRHNHESGAAAATPAGGGRVGLLLISKYVKPGSVNVTGDYNHFSLLASIEDLFGQSDRGRKILGALRAHGGGGRGNEGLWVLTRP